MGKFLFFGASFIALPALACPDLNGEYISSRGQELKIVQQAGAIQFGETQMAILDGQEHMVNSEGGATMTYKGWCPSVIKMVLEFSVRIPSGESFQGTKTLTKSQNGFHESVVGFEAFEEDWEKK
jgi:hypothetical protein